jgi:hypothetical protein
MWQWLVVSGWWLERERRVARGEQLIADFRLSIGD